jgi:N-methylhydantoinase A
MKNVAHGQVSTLPTIGIDVGGTFTDFVLQLPDGRMLLHKQPSTPHDPSEALQAGLEAVLAKEPGLKGGAMRIVHGTTIALNAVLQHKVADIAMVVSAGTRDVLEIARIRLPVPFNIRARREDPIVPRARVFEVSTRISATGAVMTDATDDEIDALCAKLAGCGVSAAAVMLLNSYIAPQPEADLAARIAARLPDMLITRSAGIWPEAREYERSIVACLNAQVHPLMQRYLSRLEDRVRTAAGAKAVIQLTSSAGGTLSIESARERPVDTMLSGPASGATAAARICKMAGIEAAISFDMGGTSADIAVIHGGEVEFTTKAHVGGLPLMMPVVGVSSIGAGGGSIISVDSYGVIKVGPESAGAVPGPVAYGLGATRPTVTDCYLVLGLIDPDRFLGGAMRLHLDKSVAALAAIAEKLGLSSAEQAAEAALKVATARMATELFKQLAQRGYEPAKHAIVPFGGAGPTHAALLAAEAGMAGLAVPPAAATFCALGGAMADVRREFVRGLGHVRIHELGDQLWENWESLEAEADEWLRGENVALIGQRQIHALDMRYAGQSFSITASIPPHVRAKRDVAGLAEAFHLAHEAIYGFRENDHGVEAVTQRLGIVGEVPKHGLPDLAPGIARPEPLSRRRVFHEGSWIESSIFRREQFGAGAQAAGPAVIEQDDTCIWLPPGWTMHTNPHGVLLITKERKEARNAA